MVLGFGALTIGTLTNGTLTNGVLSSRAASRRLTVSPDINLRLAGESAVPGALVQLAVTSPSGTYGMFPSPVISAFSGEDQYPLFLLKPVGVPSGIEGYRCSYNIADPSNFSHEFNSGGAFSEIDLPTGGVAGGPAKRYTFTINTSGYVLLHFNLSYLFRARPNMFRTQISCWLKFVSGDPERLNLRPHGWTSYQIPMTSEWRLYRVSRGNNPNFGYGNYGHGGWDRVAFELILAASNSTITFDLDVSPEYGPIAEFIPLSREVGSPVRAYPSTPKGVLSAEGVTETHLGSGFKIATTDLRGTVDRVNLDFTYTDQPLIPNTKFRGALPAATNQSTNSRGPASYFGWTITEVPGVFPAGARRFQSDTGVDYIALDYPNAPNQFYYFETIIEGATAAKARVALRDHTTGQDLHQARVVFATGAVEYSSGNAFVETLATIGPNGSRVMRIVLWATSWIAGNTVRMHVYPTDSATAVASIVHHHECRYAASAIAAGVAFVNGVPRVDGYITTSGSAVTRLAEVISTPTWTASPNLSVVLDLAVDALPSSDTVLLSRSGVALSLLADGRVRVTDGTTTITSTAAVTAGGVRRIGFAAEPSGTRLRIHDTIEVYTGAIDPSVVDRLDFGYVPWGSFDRLRIYRKALTAGELLNE